MYCQIFYYLLRDFEVKIAAMSFEIENDRWPYRGFCSFCSKIFQSKVSTESPDNS